MNNIKKTSAVFMLIVVLFTIVSASKTKTKSMENGSLSQLSGCRYICPYSGTNHAYFYGYTIDTLFCAEVLPEFCLRSVKINGKIKTAAQDESYSYALFVDCSESKKYSVVRMSTDSGNCEYYSIGEQSSLQTDSFAVMGNHIFLIKTDSVHSYVIETDSTGSILYTYRFKSPAEQLFINGTSVFVKVGDGEIFRLRNGVRSQCASIERRDRVSQNAGNGYVLTKSGRVISLNGTPTRIDRKNLISAAVTDKSQFYADSSGLFTTDGGKLFTSGIKHICGCSDNAVILYNSLDFTSLNSSEIKPAEEETNAYQAQPATNPRRGEPSTAAEIAKASPTYKLKDDVMYAVANGTTVAKLKEKGDISVFDASGNLVTSGKLKTGYIAIISGRRYTISVSGDISGEGNLNSRDTTMLMDYLVDEKTLEGVYYISADYNLDGKVNNVDLVALSRANQ